MNAPARFRQVACLALIATSACFAVSKAQAADERLLPRYDLKVGQHLVYRTVETETPGKEEKTPPKYPMKWTFDVVRQNTDKSWWIVFTQEAFGRTGDGWFELPADGQPTVNEPFGPFANPTLLFPTLPPMRESFPKWSSQLMFDRTKRKFKAIGQTAKDLWRFAEDPQTIFDPIYLSSTHREYTFDLKQGLVVEVTSTSTQKWPEGRDNEPYVQRVKLEESKMQDGLDLVAFRDEIVAYFAARKRYDELERRARHDFAHTGELYDEAKTVMQELLDRLKLPQVKALAENRFSQYETSRKYALENASRFGKLIGQPSQEWKTTDLDGNSRTLEDYRGQVVLLDFWYRGCGWCIRAMPQLNQLTSDFSGQPVAVLGMNNDSKKEDAEFVIETMKLRYPTLKNKPDSAADDDGINASYEISGWPTLVVLDGKGVIRHIHIGYSDTLRQDLSHVIRELLTEQNAAAAN